MKTLLLSFALILVSATGGYADLLIALDNPYQSGLAGDQLTFNGVISNLASPDTVYLNSFTLDLAGDDFSIDGSTFFFSVVPLSLASGANSGDIGLFTVSINDPTTDPPATWAGTYTLLGGADASAQDSLGQVAFSVTTTNIPEPSTFGLFAIGLMLVTVYRIICIRNGELTANRTTGIAELDSRTMEGCKSKIVFSSSRALRRESDCQRR